VVNKNIGFAGLLLLVAVTCFAQNPAADFSTASAICRQQFMEFDNTSSGATRYEWDFCVDDFKSLQSVASLTTLGGGYGEGYGYKLVQDNGQWYGFVTSRSNNKLYRLDFGTNPASAPVVNDLGNVNGKLFLPEGIDIVKAGGNWYGFVGSLEFSTVAQGIIRLDFGASLTNTPTAQNLGNFGYVTRFRDLKVMQQGTDLILMLVNYNNNSLIRVNYRDSFDNVISASHIVDTGTITGANLPVGIDVVKVGGSWKLLMASLSNSTILHLNFGSDLLSMPAVDASLVLTGVNRPYKIKVVEEAGIYYGVVANESSAITVVDLKDLNPLNTPTVVSHTGLPTLLGLDAIRWRGTSIVQGLSITDNAYRLARFESTCDAAAAFSTSAAPTGNYYANAGTKRIELRAFDAQENSSMAYSTVTVGPSVSPDISFTTDGAVCAGSPVTFTAVNTSGDVASYDWAFGDSGTGFGAVAAHTYAQGSYTPRVTANGSNGCTNAFSAPITIYQTPAPAFIAPTANPVCTNQLYTFTNNSVVDGGHAVTWDWLVNGESKASTEDFEFTFTQTTSQTVTLKASIPGCEETYEETITTLAEGPFVDFTVNGRCEESAVTFTNNSSGVINSFTWNFDDGTPTSSDVDVNHIFTEPGIYDVTLSASTPSGCLNSAVETVTIYSEPVISFSVQAPPFSCSGSSTMFVNNTANPTDSNIATWLWDFDDPASGANNTSSAKTPQHVYATAGDYDVSLTATTNFGCQSVQVSPITIAQTPTAAFSNDPTCEDVNVTFRDETGGTSSWDWQIGSSFYTVQNPVHQFTNPGNYTVSLTVAASNGCLASTSRQVNVPMKISPDFTFIKNCVNENTTFTDVTNDAADAIVQRRWTINGSTVIESDPVTTVTFPNVGVYAASLVTVTQSGCTSAPVNKNVSVSNRPQASFTATPESGGAPLTVQFDNNSVGAVSYLWSFDDAEGTITNDVNPEFTFVEEGEYEVELTATSIQQCSHTFSKIIRAEATLINLVLSQLNLLPTTLGGVRPEVTVVNESNVSLGDIELIMDISGKSQLRQIITGPLLPGASQVFTFPVEIADRDGIRYVCVSTLREGETETGDNRICEDVSDKPLIIPPYPNPANQFLEVEWISSQAGTTRMSLATALGATVLSVSVPVEEGYSHYSLDVRDVPAGMYVLSVQQGSLRKSFRVVIAH
jgi:PKD repeat protein